MRTSQNVLVYVFIVLLGATAGCGDSAPTPSDVSDRLQLPQPSPSQVVVIEGDTSPEVVVGSVVEFRGDGKMTDEELERGKNFILRIVKFRADGTRITVQQGNAAATVSSDGETMSFAHDLEVPERTGNYFVLVAVGKRTVSKTPLTVRAAKG